MSEKNKTNRKWTSNPKYSDNYDRIFKKDGQKDVEVDNQEAPEFVPPPLTDSTIKCLGSCTNPTVTKGKNVCCDSLVFTPDDLKKFFSKHTPK